VTSPSAYKADQDVLRTTATPQNLPFPVESFLITFDNIKNSSMDLVLLWDRTAVSVPITTDVDSKVMAEINDALNKDNKPYGQAAQYYMDNGKDLNQALAWYEKATAQQPDAFWLFYQKANCQAKLGKKADAMASANKSIELAKAAGNSDYVTLNNKLLATLK
jgi:predicted Zn-dependent protease